MRLYHINRTVMSQTRTLKQFVKSLLIIKQLLTDRENHSVSFRFDTGPEIKQL